MSELKVKPILDRIIIKRSEGADKIGSFIIPESEREAPLEGIVVATGPGWTAPETGAFTPITVKVGDKVMYMEHSASEVEIGGEYYVFIKERDLICIL